MPTQYSQSEMDFGSAGGLKLVGAFDGGAISSNGGAALLSRIERAEVLCDQLKKVIVEFPQWTLAAMVTAVQALRGVSVLVAATVVAEVGNFSRFESPRQLMAYLGLNPPEHSSGATIKPVVTNFRP